MAISDHPDGEGPGRRRPARRGYFLPGAIALAVLLAIGALATFTGFLSGGSPGRSGEEIAGLISEKWQELHPDATGVGVHCPRLQPARQRRALFRCVLHQDGRAYPVLVRDTDGRGIFTFKVLQNQRGPTHSGPPGR